MTKRHGCLLILAAGLLLLTGVAAAEEYLPVHSYKNCMPLDATGGLYIDLTPGTVYTVTVSGDAAANPMPDSSFDGVFVYYFDDQRPAHPVMEFLAEGEELMFVASANPFYAFLADKTLKDVADNSGSMTLTFTSLKGQREQLTLDAVINCIGLEDWAAAKIILVPGQYYTAVSSGDASTNMDPDGYYDGCCVFYRDISRPWHPILDVLKFGEEIGFTAHATGWVYAFLVDWNQSAMGNNFGSQLVTFDPTSAVEAETWSGIKALFR